MAKDSFKVKKSLNIKPTDPATLSNSEVGDIVIDSTDNNKLKTYNDSSSSFVSVSSVGSLDTLLAEDFETTLAADFISGNAASPDTVPTGSFGGTLADETSNQLSGVRSLKYTMNATSASSDNDFFLNDTDIALAVKQRGNFIGINFYYTYNGDDDDIRFFVLDQDDNELTQSDEYIKAASTATRFSTSVFVPSDDTGLRYGFQVVTGNSSKVFIVDDIEFSTNPFVYKNLTDIQTYEITQANTSLSNGSNELQFNLSTATIADNGTTLIVAEDDSGNTRTKFTAQRPCYVSISASSRIATASRELAIAKNGTIIQSGDTMRTGTDMANVAATGIYLDTGDYLTVGIASLSGFTGSVSSYQTSVFIKAQAESEHVVTPAKSSDTEINYLSADVTATTDPISDLTFSNLEIGAKYLLIGHFELWTQNANSTMVVEADHDGSVISKVIMDSDADAATVKNTMTMSRVFTATATTLTFSATETGTASVRGDGTAGETYVELTKLSSNFLAAVPVPLTAILKEEQPSGTEGGTFTSGAWQTRVLNTVAGDTSFVSLSSNQFTLPKGKYRITGSAPAYQVNRHRTALYDVTNSSYVEYGENELSWASGVVVTRSRVTAVISINSSTTYELRHRCQTTKTNDGLGKNSSFGVNEVQSVVEITKIK